MLKTHLDSVLWLTSFLIALFSLGVSYLQGLWLSGEHFSNVNKGKIPFLADICLIQVKNENLAELLAKPFIEIVLYMYV